MTRLKQESVISVNGVTIVEFTSHNPVIYPSGAYDLFGIISG